MKYLEVRRAKNRVILGILLAVVALFYGIAITKLKGW
jgi:hypothetical protein